MIRRNLAANAEDDSNREKIVLGEIKRRLNVNEYFQDFQNYESKEDEAIFIDPRAQENGDNSADAESKNKFRAWVQREVISCTSRTVVDNYLMRFLRDKFLSSSEAIAKLRRRRTFERTLPTISMSPVVVAALRSGAFRVIGKDLQHRWILYFNLNDYTVPALEVDDAERLVIILLEYMQAMCMAVADEDAQYILENGEDTSTKGESPYQGPKPFQQQLVLLINEETGVFRTHVPLLKNAYNIYAIVAKYYPQLIDLVLIVGASFEIRQGVKAALMSSPKEVQRMFLLLQPDDLLRYMDASVIPKEWKEVSEREAVKNKNNKKGNKKKSPMAPSYTASGTEFAEAVLRNWYTLTSFLVAENTMRRQTGSTSGPLLINNNNYSSSYNRTLKRPLFVPLPYILNVQEVVAFQRSQFVSQSFGKDQKFNEGVKANQIAANAAPLPLASMRRQSDASTNPDSVAVDETGRVIANNKVGVDAENDDEDSALITNRSRSDGSSIKKTRSAVKGNSSSFQAAGPSKESFNDGLMSAISDSATSRHFSDDEDEFLLRDEENEDDMVDEIIPCGGDEYITSQEMDAIAGNIGGSNTNGGSRNGNNEDGSANFTTPNKGCMLAIQLLHKERRLNMKMAKELQVSKLGVTFDAAHLSTMEQKLAAMHQEVNALVANVVVGAKKSAGVAGRGQPGKEGPSLKEMIDATIRSLEVATRVPETLPAMSVAAPAQREPPSEGCCCTTM